MDPVQGGAGAFPVLSSMVHLRRAQTHGAGAQGPLQPLLSLEGTRTISSLVQSSACQPSVSGHWFPHQQRARGEPTRLYVRDGWRCGGEGEGFHLFL